MATLSIILSDSLAKASQDAAGKLGISRTQFIRQAIAHELESFQAHLEEEAMIRSISAMKGDKRYLKEAEKIMNEFDVDLPADREEWWKKKS